MKYRFAESMTVAMLIFLVWAMGCEQSQPARQEVSAEKKPVVIEKEESPAMAKVVYSVQGMSCQNCVKHVEKALQKVDGVQHYRVSLEEARAEVEYDASQVSPEKILQALQETGYQIAELSTAP